LHICKQRASIGDFFSFFLLRDSCLYMFFFFSFAYLQKILYLCTTFWVYE
jgi:hypothetical protein